MNITEPIKRNAHQFPESIAAFDRGQPVTYAEFDRRIDAAAARMKSLGLNPGDAAAVLVTDRLRHLVLTLALARVGMAAVISTSIAARPGSLRIRAGFVDPGTATSGGPSSIAVDDAWWQDMIATRTASSVELVRNDAAPCLIGASSGTTGTPKGMLLTQGLLCQRMYVRPLSIFWPSRPRVACMLGRESSYAYTSVLRTFWAGGAVAFAGTAGGIQAALQQQKTSVLILSPAQLQEVVDRMPAEAGPILSLEVVEVGGGMLPARLATSARTRICQNIIVNYGAQEAGNVASAPIQVLESNPGSVGFVAPGVEIEAVDAQGQPVPPGVEGTLRVRSSSCISAYLNDPEGSAKRFVNGWFYPGDVGAVSSNRLLFLSGRSDELINAGGVKVHPHVIEEAARSFEDVADAAAFAAPDGRSGLPQIWLAVVERQPVNMEALVKHCVRELGIARAPRAVMLVKTLPRNDNGKLQRDQLATMAANARNAQATKAPAA
jgi:acyl-coenzyme A synthetase/AMP-(fatty) acid ligase